MNAYVTCCFNHLITMFCTQIDETVLHARCQLLSPSSSNLSALTRHVCSLDNIALCCMRQIFRSPKQIVQAWHHNFLLGLQIHCLSVPTITANFNAGLATTKQRCLDTASATARSRRDALHACISSGVTVSTDGIGLLSLQIW